MRVKVNKMCSEFVFVCVDHKHTAHADSDKAINGVNDVLYGSPPLRTALSRQNTILLTSQMVQDPMQPCILEPSFYV